MNDEAWAHWDEFVVTTLYVREHLEAYGVVCIHEKDGEPGRAPRWAITVARHPSHSEAVKRACRLRRTDPAALLEFLTLYSICGDNAEDQNALKKEFVYGETIRCVDCGAERDVRLCLWDELIFGVCGQCRTPRRPR